MREGERIKISDGYKEPSLHHNKKHSVWENKNKICYFKKNMPEYEQIMISDQRPQGKNRMNVFWNINIAGLTIEKVI